MKRFVFLLAVLTVATFTLTLTTTRAFAFDKCNGEIIGPIFCPCQMTCYANNCLFQCQLHSEIGHAECRCSIFTAEGDCGLATTYGAGSWHPDCDDQDCEDEGGYCDDVITEEDPPKFKCDCLLPD